MNLVVLRKTDNRLAWINKDRIDYVESDLMSASSHITTIVIGNREVRVKGELGEIINVLQMEGSR